MIAAAAMQPAVGVSPRCPSGQGSRGRRKRAAVCAAHGTATRQRRRCRRRPPPLGTRAWRAGAGGPEASGCVPVAR